MPISIKYNGRFGNNVFQFVAGALEAQRLKTRLVSSLPENTILSPKEKGGSDKPSLFVRRLPKTIINDENYGTASNILSSLRHYQLRGYFQYGDLFSCHKEKIFDLFDLPPIQKNTQDIVLHIRLGDFYHDDYNSSVHNNMSEILPPSWYCDILDSGIDYDRVHIVFYDGGTPSELVSKYLSYFEKYAPIIHRNKPEDVDFHFIRSFDKIISSNSTFSWWAAFLSEASVVYIPENIGYIGIGPQYRSHGKHVKGLWNVRGVSKPIKAGFCDIKQL